MCDNPVSFLFYISYNATCVHTPKSYRGKFRDVIGSIEKGMHFMTFLAHLTRRATWAIPITWGPSSSSVVRRKLFQKSSLKVLDQWKPNLVRIITMVSSFKIVSGDAVHQPTWPLLLKIEHMVKLQVFGNNSKTVNNIKNLAR